MYRSPYELAYAPDGRLLAVTDRTARELVVIDPAAGTVATRIRTLGEPTGLAWSQDGSRIYVAEYGAGQVSELSVAEGKRLRSFAVGRYPTGVALAPRRGGLLVANALTHEVSWIDVESGRELRRITVVRQPFCIVVSTNETQALVSNRLPGGRSTDPGQGAAVSVLDLNRQCKVTDIVLPTGASSAHHIALSGDGRWAYVVHTVGRVYLPTTTLERGWVNNNAVTLIDLEKQEVYITLLLDYSSEGAADPWGVVCAKDDSKLYLTASGVHQLLTLDLASLHRYLQGQLPDHFAMTESVWARIKEEPRNRWILAYNNDALYNAGLIDRLPLEGLGPRGLSQSPDGNQLAVALYYSGKVQLLDPRTGSTTHSLSLGTQPEPDPARRGEMIFHDATYSFQFWLSCATCHPDNARADGLNWDMLNDGLGNPKNTKSLLWAHRTPPMTWRGVRGSYDASVEKGFQFLFQQPAPGDVVAVKAYLQNLQPLPSPFRNRDGSLTRSAKRGEVLFFSDRTRCAKCHPPPLYTDLRQHNVGTRRKQDKDDQFDTPALVELFRTAPYLHDGSSTDLKELLTLRNPKNQHGRTAHLSEGDREDLVAFLLSL